MHSQQYAKTEPLYAVCAKQANAPPIKKVSMPVAPPVVLREPTPPSTLNLMTADRDQNYPPHHMSHMRHCPQPPRNLLISSNLAVNKRAPPPPKRSETTQLSTT